MKIKILNLILMIIIMQGFKKYDKNEPLYIKLSNEIIKKTSKEIQKDKDLRFIGSGGELMYNVKMLGLSFRGNECCNIDDARRLIIYFSKKFLNNINMNENIHPYLNARPFNSENIQISIFFNKTNLSASKFLNGVSVSNGIIRYYIPDADEVLKTYHMESYDEALIALEEKSYSDK